MSASTSVQSGHASTLTPDSLRALLGAGGFRSTMVVLHGQHVLSAGCSVALQFGNEMARDAYGVQHSTVRASVVINGAEQRFGGVTRWQIGKALSVIVGGEHSEEHCWVAIEADLLLGSAICLDDLLIGGGQLLQHLQLLISDTRAMLRGLPVSGRRGEDAPPPVVRIEARLFGEIAAGRSGLLQPDPGEGRSVAAMIRTTPRHIGIAVATCDCLAEQILPDLSWAVRAVIAQARQGDPARPHATDAQSWRSITPSRSSPEHCNEAAEGCIALGPR